MHVLASIRGKNPMTVQRSTVVKLREVPKSGMAKVLLTPELAAEWLEYNTINRPMNDLHMRSIARQIMHGRWKYNGNTIKITKEGDVLDGQHRMWAVLEARIPVETVFVYGLDRDAFTTIDTLQKTRSGADIIALCGTSRYRNVIASALAWLLRWQRGIITEYKAPQYRIDNADLEEAFRAHPEIIRAVEAANRLRRLCNVSLIACFYYVLANRDQDLADRMMQTLEDPAQVGMQDPYFKLRTYFTADHHKMKDPVMTIALAIKATNMAHAGRKCATLSWKSHGNKVEPFPVLDLGKGR